MASNEWQPIESHDGTELECVDLWLDVPASPRSMGWGDSFRVCDAYRRGANWYHRVGGQELHLATAYITHWKHLPPAPDAGERP